MHTPRPSGLRLALVSPHPPSRTTLNEYGFHLVRALAHQPEVGEVVLLHDDVSGTMDLPPKVRPVASWRFDSILNPFRLVRAARRERPDVVIFNIQFASFGDGRVPAAMGLLAPLLCRLAGIRTITLQHNIVETVDLDQAGYTKNRTVAKVFTFIGETLTRLILRSHRVVVLVPRFASILRTKYHADNVMLLPHGVFELGAPTFEELPQPERPTIMTFGKFGTYKRVEPLIEAFRMLKREIPDLQLVVAGGDSPNCKGYLAGVEAAQPDLDGIRFTGYVPEEDVPKVFTGASVVAFPYVATTGSSGPLHQAAAYGRACVLPAIGDFVDVVHEEGFAAATFEPDDVADLARALGDVLRDDDAREAMAVQNFTAAEAQQLERLAAWYVLHAIDVASPALGAPRARLEGLRRVAARAAV